MPLIIKVDPLLNIKMALGNWDKIPWPDDPIGTQVIDEITGKVVFEHIDYCLKSFVPPHNGEYFYRWLGHYDE